MLQRRILATVPNGDGWVHKGVAAAITSLVSDRRFDVVAQFPTWRPYEHNLNRCAQEIVDRGFDYWLNIDADNPPIRNPLDLVDLGLDLIGLPTVVWHSAVRGDRPYYLNALDAVDDGWKPHEPADGLQEVDAIGSGCFLASLRLIEAMRAYPFRRETDARGFVTRGHDYLFCHQAKKIGFRIFAHFDYPCRHFNEVELREVVEAMHAMQGAA